MPLGTFTLVIGGEQQDGTAENKARLHLLPQGVDTLIDADADEFKFPSKFAKATGEGISLSPTYELILFTDSTSGPSTTIGYKGYVATGNGGRVDFEFAAQQAGTTKALTDLTEEVVVPISTTQQYRDEAETARDEAVTAAASVPTEAELSATYAPVRLTRPGSRFVFFGDSITAGSDDPAANARGSSWPVYLSILSGQRARYIRNAGIGGNTSAQMLARFDTDVTPHSPTAVTLLAGTNDIGGSVPLATFQANVQAIVAKIRALGAVPILCAIPPNNISGRKQAISTWNAWLRRYAETEGIFYVPFYQLLVDPVTGSYLAAYDSGDGTHPNDAGRLAMGTLAWNTLNDLLPPLEPPIAFDGNDPNNLLAGGLFPDLTGWGTYGGTSGVTRSVVSDASINGNWGQAVITAGGPIGFSRGLSSSWSVGDKLLFTGLVAAAPASTATWNVNLNFQGGTPNHVRPASNLAGSITRGRFYVEQTVPAGTTSIDVDLTASGAGTFKFAQLTAYNLTTMGL